MEKHEKLITHKAPQEIKDLLSSGLTSDSIKHAVYEMYELARGLVPRATSYDFILGDDASARLISLFAKKIMDRIRREANLPPVETRFVASGRMHAHDAKFSAIKEHLRKSISGKTLLVTEHIATGQSIIRLIEILKSLGLDFDVATLSADDVGLGKVESELRKGQKLIYGKVSSSARVRLYGNYDLSGVQKYEGTESIFSKRTIDNPTISEQTKTQIRESTKTARKDINLLAEKVLNLLSTK